MSTSVKSLELKKHVAAIHSTSSMSLVQRKIANGLLFHAYPELMEKDEYQISIQELCDLIGYNSHDHKTIKKALINLLSTVIEWNLLDGESPEKSHIWNASSIIADASIQGSICKYSYSKRMKELLHRPEVYGRLNMAIQAKFKSTYGLALYENCIRYQNLPQTSWFDYGVFRKLMGVGESEYLIFRDFKRRVLDKAVNEVNAYSPISLTPELKKAQRKVIAIRFLIQPRLEKHSKTFTANALEDRLASDYGLSQQQVTQLLVQYKPTYILEKMALIEKSKSFQLGKITNLCKYLEQALMKDFQPAISSKKSMLKKTEVEKKAKNDRQGVERLYQHYLNQQALAFMKALETTRREKIETEFKKHLAKTVYLKLYETQGTSNPLVQDELLRFVKANYPEALSACQSFDAFYQDN